MERWTGASARFVWGIDGHGWVGLRGHLVTRCLDEGFTSVEVRTEAEERWAQQIKERAAGIPTVDLGCAPNPYAELLGSGRPGGPVEYLRICQEWLENGWKRDLVFRSPADPTA